jgi:HEAT repeat protein
MLRVTGTDQNGVITLFSCPRNRVRYKLLKDEDFEVRVMAVDALAELGAKEFAPAIAELLKDEGVWARAAGDLRDLGAEEFAPRIAELLKDGDSEVRWYVADVLGDLGAKEFVPRIAELLKEGDFRVRMDAASALGLLGAREFAPEIEELLTDRDSDVRGMAAIALVELGQVADVRAQAGKDTQIVKDIQSVMRKGGPLEARAKSALKALGVEEEKR